MKQILQNARTGALEIVEVPAPSISLGQVLVRNAYSVMSPGTEKMSMDFARMSMLQKARSRPDLVKQVLRKLRNEGPLSTFRTVVDKLDAPQPLGYASAGTVLEVASDVTGFAPGDRVACAGAGYAAHAELVVVPENLVVRVPDSLPLKKAAFATLGAIALQGVRVGNPTLGERAAVVGLGLIGQLTVQFLVANGCRVLGIDLDPKRVAEAKEAGAEWGMVPSDDHSAWIDSVADGQGADLVIVAAASNSSAPLQLAAELCRMKGRVVAVGATAMDLDRRTFYDKELELRMSMSYGPGRYDRRYEERGYDYPMAYVRWTENRNLETFVQMAARGSIDPEALDVEMVEFESALGTYEALAKGERRSLAALFEYSGEVDTRRTRDSEIVRPREAKSGHLGVAFVGAGNYAKSVLLPALKSISGIENRVIVTSTGPSAQRTAERFGFQRCSTDMDAALGDSDVDLVFIATQHGQHADQAEAALLAGKSVWLEKPMGLTAEQVDRVSDAARKATGLLFVGYNRRFSSHSIAVHDAFTSRSGPMTIAYQVAAGATPAGTWIMEPDAGGGRILGEVCHFVDLCSYLVDRPLDRVYAVRSGRDAQIDDSIVVTMQYRDGSVATLQYLASASVELPKERWEVHADGRSALCQNFKTTQLPGGKRLRGANQDKGQAKALAAVVSAVRDGGAPPVAIEELVSTSRATLAILESIETGMSIAVNGSAR